MHTCFPFQQDMNYEMEVVLPDTEETMTSNLEREKLGVVVINDQF